MNPTWWRVGFDKNREHLSVVREMLESRGLNYGEDAFFMSMPMALYPTKKDLPAVRREVPIWPDLAK